MPKNTSYGETVGKVLKYLANYRWLFALSIIFAVITVALTLYVPILIGDAIDLAVGKGKVDIDGIQSILVRIGAVSTLHKMIINFTFIVSKVLKGCKSK